MTCTHTWCDSTMPNHLEHTGILATVSAGGNDVDVMIYIDSERPAECVVYSFEWHWGIDGGTADREFAVLRSLLDQIEAVVTEAEKIYPRKTGAEVTA